MGRLLASTPSPASGSTDFAPEVRPSERARAEPLVSQGTRGERSRPVKSRAARPQLRLDTAPPYFWPLTRVGGFRFGSFFS